MDYSMFITHETKRIPEKTIKYTTYCTDVFDESGQHLVCGGCARYLSVFPPWKGENNPRSKYSKGKYCCTPIWKKDVEDCHLEKDLIWKTQVDCWFDTNNYVTMIEEFPELYKIIELQEENDEVSEVVTIEEEDDDEEMSVEDSEDEGEDDIVSVMGAEDNPPPPSLTNWRPNLHDEILIISDEEYIIKDIPNGYSLIYNGKITKFEKCVSIVKIIKTKFQWKKFNNKKWSNEPRKITM